MRLVWSKIRALLDLIRYFRNPALVIAMRLGLVRVPFFPYRIKTHYGALTMLARPASVAMGDLFVLRELFVDETYGDLLPLLESAPVSVVDIGANLGSFVVWLHRRHGVRAASCFEPEPTSFQLCRFNLALNGCQTAVPVQAAMGGQAREITLVGDAERPGAVSIYKPSPVQGGSKVQVLSFEKWLAEQPGGFDVLKLDCEGAEWEILEHTAAGRLRQFRLIIAEVHGDPSGRHGVDDFPRLLEERGFRTVRWDGRMQGIYFGARQS